MLTQFEPTVNDPTTGWQSVCLPGWDSNTECPVAYPTSTARWDHTGKPVVPMGWVLVGSPNG